MAAPTAPIDPGQFDDAPEEGTRRDTAFIDLSDSESSDASEANAPSDSESSIDDFYDDTRVEDEDWENAERDFTKQYNRLRQHVAVRTGSAAGTSSSTKKGTAVAPLPAVNHPKQRAAAQTNEHAKDKTTDQLAALSKYSSRLAKIDVPYTMGVGVNRKGPSATANMKDKADRATNEQVLDPRTRIILFKMIGRGLVHEVNGCVSTGKEANVYHALTPESAHLALKIYKTSILVFKDRDKYVSGEYRFRRGYSRHNPRKMVRVWAEKEMRNLKRLVAAGIRCPEPIEVRENVLVMTFVGDAEGWASPRLKDASLPASECTPLYVELISIVRTIYQECKLVHADLSEYNILFHDGHLWIIDVSQSVEHDHPHAFDFLRNDLKNVEDFFGRLGVPCLGLRRAFEFVTKENVAREGEADEDVLRRWMEEGPEHGAEAQDGEDAKEQASHEDAVFMRSYIPRTLNEVYDPERDVEVLQSGGGKGLIYADAVGLVLPEGENAAVPSGGAIQEKDEDEEQEEGEADGSGEEDSDEDGEGYEERKPRGHRHEDKDAKKERKKAVKAENAERRKQKMPKAEKKRIMKKSRGG
ncbi:RIO1 family-domain-containing protein [Schizophyllum amplum]|uniref:Serine/threonine-protein kinase RIO1 n=1 Tax=Schizophyllum amplum TaxID=97359 RepID=A0A550CGT5_9AGAR|nr:RIO1 family-domain-containing protein [Auriculariopsis ampla]